MSHINADLFNSKSDLEQIIADLALLKERIEEIVDTAAIDSAVEALSDVAEEMEEDDGI